MLCPCGSNKNLNECCGPMLEGNAVAASPEQLMRSRYTAFSVKNLNYVIETTDPQARVGLDEQATKQWMDESTFTKLEILNASEEGTKGVVEFKAHYSMNGTAHIHHEVSRF